MPIQGGHTIKAGGLPLWKAWGRLTEMTAVMDRPKVEAAILSWLMISISMQRQPRFAVYIVIKWVEYQWACMMHEPKGRTYYHMHAAKPQI